MQVSLRNLDGEGHLVERYPLGNLLTRRESQKLSGIKNPSKNLFGFDEIGADHFKKTDLQKIIL